MYCWFPIWDTLFSFCFVILLLYLHKKDFIKDAFKYITHINISAIRVTLHISLHVCELTVRLGWWRDDRGMSAIQEGCQV